MITCLMYATEHGEIANDEVNIIKPGANYGWPRVEGRNPAAPGIESPLVSSNGDTWAPSGIAFINQGPWINKLLVAGLRSMQILAFTLNNAGTGIEKTESLLWNKFGRLRDVVLAKDGSLYISTSNRDGRTIASQDDDKIIKLTPKSS